MINNKYVDLANFLFCVSCYLKNTFKAIYPIEMSKLRSPINYKNMEVELLEALRADELYKLQNDAKLRAVEQKVPTYEDFRQLVSVFYLL